jgi:SAM-dependent methyltransferase
VSGVSKPFIQHCKELVSNVTNVHGGKELSVLDIACNDGTMLEEFRNAGHKVFGVDPAENIRQMSIEKGIDVEVAFWSNDVAETLGKTFDVITATNVFAHVDDNYSFLEACKKVLNPNGLVVIEFPYAKDMIAKVEFDTIYHEHISYFTVSSFNALVTRLGYKIHNIQRTNIHGGSIRFSISLDREETNDVSLLMNEEEKSKLYDVDAYKSFQTQMIETKKDIETYLNGKEYIGFGASAKGNTMLNYFNLTNMKYVVDDTKIKQGKYTPGCDIEVRPVNEGLDVDGDLYVVCMCWNFKDEVIRRIKSIRSEGRTHLIFYVPNFYVELI